MIEKNPEGPHAVIIWISAEVHEVKNGMCSGMIEHKVDRFPVQIKADSLADAKDKLNAFLEKVKQ